MREEWQCQQPSATVPQKILARCRGWSTWEGMTRRPLRRRVSFGGELAKTSWPRWNGAMDSTPTTLASPVRTSVSQAERGKRATLTGGEGASEETSGSSSLPPAPPPRLPARLRIDREQDATDQAQVLSMACSSVSRGTSQI